jgi:hypothetical protein
VILEITHAAFSDESSHNQERYRSIAIISVKKEIVPELSLILNQSLVESGLSDKELKWQKIRTAQYKFAGLRFLSNLFPFILKEDLRIDSIIWDTYDYRHKLNSRDDVKNFGIMYYHLIINCLKKRWPSRSLWGFFPDETTQINWEEFLEIMDNSSTIILGRQKNLPRISNSRYSFRIIDFEEKKSIDTPLVQVADLFAGMAAFSCNRFSDIQAAIQKKMGQSSLFNYNLNISNSVRERADIIYEIIRFCRKHKMHVSFESSNGFRSYNPNMPINFWRYEPQHEFDKAPTRKNTNEF